MTSSIVFVHLKNDFSGSPVVLTSVIRASQQLFGTYISLYVGSRSQGVLDDVAINKTYFCYTWHENKVLRLLSYTFSQICLLIRLTLDKKIAPDSIIYVNTVLPVGALIYGWLTHKKLVCHVHELPTGSSKKYRVLFEVAFRLATKIIVVSSYQKDQFLKFGRPISVIPNCLNVFDRTQPLVESESSAGMNVLFVGSLKKYKGINEFVDLASELSGDSRFKFRMVLNGALVDINKYRGSNSSITNLTIEGPTSKMGEQYAWADVVVNLSLPCQWIETFGLTLLEAMSFGKPVIAPLIGGHLDFVEDGVNGFLIDAANQAGLIGTLQTLCTNQNMYAALATSAIKTAAEYQFDKYCAKVNSIFGDL